MDISFSHGFVRIFFFILEHGNTHFKLKQCCCTTVKLPLAGESDTFLCPPTRRKLFT